MKSYNLIPTQATCPVCGLDSAHVLWSVSAENAARHYVNGQAEPERFLKLVAHIQQLWDQESCEVVECESCGFCFSHPYVAGDAEFYALAYERSSYPTWKWEHQRTYETLKRDRQDFTLLEIGAGDGAFIRNITPALIPQDKVLCCEFSDYGQQQILKYGVNCLSQDVRTIQDQVFQHYFDVICLFQVIEHLDRLDALFEHLNELTRENASLFISVPSRKLIEFSELNGGLLDMPPNHIGRWNQRCFETIGQRWGWRVEGYEVEDASLMAKASLFYKYRFWRQSQQPDTIENRIVQLKNPKVRKVMQAAGIGASVVSTLPALPALQSPELGFSDWVHLRK